MYKKFLITILLSAFLLIGVKIFLFSSDDKILISPWIGKGKLANNLWFPKIEPKPEVAGISSDSNAPAISAKAAFFVDADTGQVLYQKNPYERLPIASLTKIMTAIVTLENKKMDDEVAISPWADSMEPDHMELIAGEKLTVRELLYGVFLVSANDAAEALAENSIRNRDEFISQMNAKALQLGMKDTLFINPSGLEEDGRQQYSSAYDVALMSRYAVKHFQGIEEIASTPHIVLPQTATHQDYDLYSGINLLTTYPGVKGLKTGFTPEAGLTLVTLAEKNGYQVIGVLLNTENRREEARMLLDYSFQKLEK